MLSLLSSLPLPPSLSSSPVSLSPSPLPLSLPPLPQEQYEFCYKAVLEFLESFDSYANFSDWDVQDHA